MALKKIAAMCRVCPNVDACDHKRMECHGFIENAAEGGLIAPSAAPIAAPLVEDMVVPHRYRDVKIAEGVTVTIDLEDFKKEFETQIARGLGIPGYMLSGE